MSGAEDAAIARLRDKNARLRRVLQHLIANLPDEVLGGRDWCVTNANVIKYWRDAARSVLESDGSSPSGGAQHNKGGIMLDSLERVEVVLSHAPWADEQSRADAAQLRVLGEALKEWWQSHRPVAWTAEQHAANPTINTTTPAEHKLAALLSPGRDPRSEDT